MPVFQPRRDPPSRRPAAPTAPTPLPASATRAPGGSATVTDPPGPAGAPPGAPATPTKPSASASPLASPGATRPARPSRKEKARKAKAPRNDAGPFRWADVAAAGAFAVVAGLVAATQPAGPLRMLFGLPMVLLVPGYLVLQAFRVPAARGKELTWQLLASLGISPAVLGLFALSTAIVQGGFKLGVILVMVTVACLVLATTALVRRRALTRTDPQATRSDATSAVPGAAPAAAATAKTGPARP